MSQLDDEEERMAALDDLADDGLDYDNSPDGMQGAVTRAHAAQPAPAPVDGPEYRPDLMPPAPGEFVPNDMPVAPPSDAPAPPGDAARVPPPPAAKPDVDARLAALQALTNDDGSSDKLRATAGDDRRQAYMDRASEALAAATRREPVRYSTDTGPSVTSVEEKLLGRDDARRNALIKAYAEKGKPEDPSLALRRQHLNDEADNRLKFSQKQLESLDAWRNRKAGTDETKVGVDQGNLDERTRHDQAMEAARLKAKGAGGGGMGAPAKIVAGDLQSVPAGDRDMVKAIAEGRMSLQSVPAKGRERVLRAVTAFAPDYDASRFNAYNRVQGQQATDKSLVAVDVAREHMKRARANIPDNFDSPTANRIKQVFMSGTGQDTLTPFETDMLVAAHELANAYGVGNQEGQHAIDKLLEPNQSRAQLLARLSEAEELLAGKLEGSKRQMERVAPTHVGGPAAAGDAPRTYRSKKDPSRKITATESERLKAKNPDDWEPVP